MWHRGIQALVVAVVLITLGAGRADARVPLLPPG